MSWRKKENATKVYVKVYFPTWSTSRTAGRKSVGENSLSSEERSHFASLVLNAQCARQAAKGSDAA